VLGLATKIASVLPALRSPELFPDFSIQMGKDPAFAARHFLRQALPSGHRLLLLVDQMEELFTREGIGPEDRQQFAAALEALARSGSVWIVATMRSDFSHLCQSVPALVRLRDGRGQVDLLAPTADGIARVIQDPVRLAGLRYERNREGVSLGDLLLRDATEHRELLPFLSHILRVLVEHRTPEGVLTFKAYQDQMGGADKEANFRQALANYAETVFLGLPEKSQAALEGLWPQLITLGGDDGKQPLRQYPLKETLTKDPHAAVLVERFIAARLFTASSDRDDDRPTVTIVHETLFRTWDRAAGWIARNQDKLQILANVERSQKLWVQGKREKTLLIPMGLPLRQASDLRRKPGAVKIDHVTDYIRRSEKRAGRIRRRPLWLIPVGLAIWGAYLGSLEWSKTQIEAAEEASIAELSDAARVPQPIPLTPKVGQRFINGASMEMIWCPPGTFVMGGTIYNDEHRHDVTLTHGFWMARHELTQGSWNAIMPDDPSDGEGDPYPMNRVDWNQSVEFCLALTEKERAAQRIPRDWQYSLPTEAQWEYACRAGTTTEFWFGDSLDGRRENVNGKQPFGTPLPGLFLERLTAVGAYPANPWGFHDMHGNVSEWCFDAYQQDITALSEDPLVEPEDAGSVRVFRGGIAVDQAVSARSAYRNWFDPSDRYDALGLRPVLVPSQTRPEKWRR
jgi:formylglycine-generating enzyme required for sulfatase activity